jgi:hypothetical protein
MAYPGYFESVLFTARWGRDRIEPRDLTAGELADIATLRAAHRIIDEAKAALDRLPVVRFNVDHTPRHTSSQLEWEIEHLEESIREIQRQPEIEAERAEWERDA